MITPTDDLIFSRGVGWNRYTTNPSIDCEWMFFQIGQPSGAKAKACSAALCPRTPSFSSRRQGGFTLASRLWQFFKKHGDKWWFIHGTCGIWRKTHGNARENPRILGLLQAKYQGTCHFSWTLRPIGINDHKDNRFMGYLPVISRSYGAYWKKYLSYNQYCGFP